MLPSTKTNNELLSIWQPKSWGSRICIHIRIVFFFSWVLTTLQVIANQYMSTLYQLQYKTYTDSRTCIESVFESGCESSYNQVKKNPILSIIFSLKWFKNCTKRKSGLRFLIRQFFWIKYYLIILNPVIIRVRNWVEILIMIQSELWSIAIKFQLQLTQVSY